MPYSFNIDLSIYSYFLTTGLGVYFGGAFKFFKGPKGIFFLIGVNFFRLDTEADFLGFDFF